MRRNDGIVIVASLIVMMVVLAIAVGMLFLTQTNLKITENARGKAQAQAKADSGTDAMLVAIEHYFDAHDGVMPTYNSQTKTFNTGFTKPTITAGTDNNNYTVDFFGARGANYVLEVSGSTPNGATHKSEVLFEGNATPGEPEPVYASGLVSEGTITLTGTSNFVSAGLHGNAGYSFTAFSNTTWKECVTRNATTGRCDVTRDINVNSLPVSAAANRTSWTCFPDNSAVCTNQKPNRLTDPITITPNYLGRRDAAITASSHGTRTSSVFGINCDTIYNASNRVPTLTASNLSSKGFTSGSTVCIESGTLSLPSATITGVKIISKEQINIASNTTLVSSMLVSTTGSVAGSPNNNIKVTIRNSRIYSQGAISFNGQQCSFEGTTTIASATSILVNGSSKITSINGQPKIGVGFVSEGPIEIKGSSDWFAVSIAGGTFNYRGTSVLHGSVASKGPISVSGGIDIDSGMALNNDDFLETTTQEYLAENSRR